MNFLQSRNNKRNNSIQAQATTDHVHRTRELRWLRAYLVDMSKTERKVTVVCTTVSSRAPHAGLASSELSAPKQCKLMHAERK
jgi:hypothetical protein